MPDEPEVLIFEIDLDGVVRTQEASAQPVRSSREGSSPGNHGTSVEGSAPTTARETMQSPSTKAGEAESGVEIMESEVSQWLNQKSDDIASDIEREVRRVLRPFVFGSVNVQAEVSFEPGGSLIIAGTVMAVVGALGDVGSSPEVSVISSKTGKHSPHRSMATTSSPSDSR